MVDVFYKNNGVRKPVIIYAHGFAGFKDWGNFNLIANEFAIAGFTFLKFNFSYNGTTPDAPEDFTDLEAFGHNNYSKELEDLQVVIDWAKKEFASSRDVDPENLFLIGHSLGGGISIIKAAEEPSIKKLATWASISECITPWGNWPAEKLAEWKYSGVAYYQNSRTKQQMPLYYQLYEDYVNNSARLSIENSIKKLEIPILLCHGTQDEAVPLAKAEQLKQWQPRAQLFTIASDHVFGRKHPYSGSTVPAETQEVVNATVNFLSN